MKFEEIIYKIKRNFIPTRISSSDYISYLQRHGITVGKGTFFFSPLSTTIDIQRPWMLHIGDYCKITQNVTILCHDYSRSVLRRVYGEIIGEAEETWIGNNVFIGLNSVICMGANIGNNVIIGAGSIVTGRIPDDSVAVGSPAKVICSIDEYYRKRKSRTIDEAKLYVRKFYEFNKRYPTASEMGPFWQLFMPRDRKVLKEERIFTNLSGDNESEIIDAFLAMQSEYESYEAFLQQAFCRSGV